jgi:hypothetical protein
MRRASIPAALAAILFALPATAQSPARGTGLAMTGGAGIGWTRPACEFCRRDRAAGPVAYLQVTTQMSTSFALGAEARFWARNDEVFELIGALGAVAYLFPTPGGPFHIKGGISYLSYRAYDDDGDLVANMPAIQLGAGYRFRISDGLGLTNFVNVVTGRFGTLRSDDAAVVSNMGVTSFQLGLALTRY